MENEYSMWMAIACVIYLIGWYVFVQIIKLTAPVEIEEWKRHNEKSEERDIPDIKLYYIIIGLGSIWFLWLILCLVYAVYYIIKKLIKFIYNVETYR
jgi:hypothetical protein